MGNALWKEALLHKRISLADAIRSMDYFSLVYKIMQIVNPSPHDCILELAGRLVITFYDASYIAAAHDNTAILVTDDRKLLSKIKRSKTIIKSVLGGGMEATTLNDLLKRPPGNRG